MDDIKRCSKCDNVKELAVFNFRKDTQTYKNQCRDCIKLINKEYRTMNEDKIKIKRTKYCKNTKNKNFKRIYAIDYRERNRDKIQL